MRQSYGAENYMMAGRAMDPNFLFVWPTVSIGIQNEEYLLNNTITQLPAADFTKEQEASVKEKVLSKMSALYSSSRLWDDGVILPQNSRKVLGQCLDIVSGPLPPSSEATEPMFRM
ncbi:methylcrotonoyl-CoA carboxylase beta chain, mitochondrial-like [Lingula anatina]|uniref:Methylcrotonoyl-CoA carboxylase beta chain, mitochondrial-like n=1 Tax=Lingula anatina TaxID=7574 RepID=A0A2R2MS89_LINAN|nr:methylcrotonoyl-CoA carboxylase beta chain, mitochondrial-like [Lingula anatina]XP_023933131.1 methylcrotonoyl-CoA carboxylase beta chain, mitochondrial-like [Lingula anatina]|eukprot:XP_023933130.1 methylcrotonoyl-CoA carboxylase beta chain, mitochondrial-like [Lingula anatina]